MFEHDKRPRATPKDFFLNVLTIVTLYVSAISFTRLVFQLINVWFPDPLEFGGMPMMDGANDAALNAIRMSISSLVVFFPAYVGTMIFLQKTYNLTPFKRELWIRRWLIYFTLFAASLIIMGDVVALVNSALSGELKMRFVLKVLTLLFVSGSIFVYYFWDIRKYRTE
ncbi:MAG: DUF5671 domain-containing protein [Patescibacteria group bacterium]